MRRLDSGSGAAGLAAVGDQRDATCLAARGEGDEGRSAVRQGSGDATGRDGVHAGHSPEPPNRIARPGDGTPARRGLGCLSRSGGQGHAEERDDGQARSRGGGSRGGGAGGDVAPVAGGRRRGRRNGPARTARRAGGSPRSRWLAPRSRRRLRPKSPRPRRGRRPPSPLPPWPNPRPSPRPWRAPSPTTAPRPRMPIGRSPSRTSAVRASSARRSGHEPRPVAALGAVGRTQAPLARAPWPGVVSARRGAFTRGR